MWGKLPKILGQVALLELCLVLLGHSLPLSDAGPHVLNGWGESIRKIRLKARKHGQESYLRIHDDGRVDGERHQSSHSILEIKSIAFGGIVVIKGCHSSRYLCMASDGTLYGLDYYFQEECTFKEELLDDGYNMYRSQTYGIAISLSKDKQRHQYKGKGYLPLSRFLPINHRAPVDVSQSIVDEDDDYDNEQTNVQNVHSMDPLGLVQRLMLHKKNVYQEQSEA